MTSLVLLRLLLRLLLLILSIIASATFTSSAEAGFLCSLSLRFCLLVVKGPGVKKYNAHTQTRTKEEKRKRLFFCFLRLLCPTPHFIVSGLGGRTMSYFWPVSLPWFLYLSWHTHTTYFSKVVQLLRQLSASRIYSSSIPEEIHGCHGSDRVHNLVSLENELCHPMNLLVNVATCHRLSRYGYHPQSASDYYRMPYYW